MKKKLLIEIIAALLIILFLYTGLNKLFEHTTFRVQLSRSPWALLANLSGTVSWVLPIGEVLIVVLLLIPRYRFAGFLLSAILFTIFLVYLTVLLSSGVELPCTCGGIISSMSWTAHVYFNAVCLALSVTSCYLMKHTPNFNIVNILKPKQ